MISHISLFHILNQYLSPISDGDPPAKGIQISFQLGNDGTFKVCNAPISRKIRID